MNALTTPSINTRALLVDLRISQWTARKIDKTATEQVAQANGIDKSVGTYYKSVINGKALEPIKQLVNAARAYHYKMTLPWADSGPRVLSSVAYFEYMGEMQTYATQFETEYKNFEQQYAYHRVEAQRKLGPLFNDSEYPDLNTLADKFSFDLRVTPLPMADDFRVELGDDEVEKLRATIKAQTEAVVGEAVKDVYVRALDVVEAFVDRLSEEDKVFRDSLVTNAQELVATMPKLNFTGDPALAALCERMKETLCQHEPAILRNNVSARKATHEAALAVKKDLLDFFGGV